VPGTDVAPPSCKVYTPAALATALVAALDNDIDSSWLEPCAGNGAFLTALSQLGVSSSQVTALDLDTDCVVPGWDSLRTGIDFVEWSQSTASRFDRIVSNPPFVSIGRLSPGLKAAALSTQLANGDKVSLRANYWCIFLSQAVRLLRKCGHLGFVLPASWEYADYAAPFRTTLPKMFKTFDVHRSISPLFDGVQEGSVVIVGKGFGLRHESQRYFEHASVADLVEGLASEIGGLASSVQTQVPFSHTPEPMYRTLDEVMAISIGAVTGDAAYFLLSEARRKQLRLPVAACHPVVSHASDLVGACIDAETWTRLRNGGRRIWLFRPPDSQLSHPSVRSYLELSREMGGCNSEAGKVKTRSPWYRIPLHASADGFISGMSRNGPWICLNRFGGLSASNTLYTVRFRHRLSPDQQAMWALSILTSEAQERLRPLARRYPDGLRKYEPGDLSALRLPRPTRWQGAEEYYSGVVPVLLSGDHALAFKLADKWFSASETPVKQSA
jgi:adenine-specific DNA-methyltransferase